jgi:hypothetical protein
MHTSQVIIDFMQDTHIKHRFFFNFDESVLKAFCTSLCALLVYFSFAWLEFEKDNLVFVGVCAF